MNNTISISTSSVYPMRIAAAFRAAADLGFDGIELMVTPSEYSHNIKIIKKLSQVYSVPVLSVHAPTLLLCSFVWGVNQKNKLHKTIQLASELNTDTVVIHPPLRTNPYSKIFFTNLEKEQNNTDIKLAVENMFPWKIRGKGFVPYSPRYLDIANQSKYLTLDFSHAALSGLNTVEFAKKYYSKIQMIHLCDGTIHNNKKNKIMDEHLIPGEGEMPIKEVFKELKSHQWNGRVTLEINTRNSRTYEKKLKLLEKSLNYYKNI